MPVFCTVAGMIAIYLLIIVWARHMDKKDIARVRSRLTHRLTPRFSKRNTARNSPKRHFMRKIRFFRLGRG